MRTTLNQDLDFNPAKSELAEKSLMNATVYVRIKGDLFLVAHQPLSSSNWGFNYLHPSLSKHLYVIIISHNRSVWIAGTDDAVDYIDNRLSTYGDVTVSFLASSDARIKLDSYSIKRAKADDPVLLKLAKRGMQA